MNDSLCEGVKAEKYSCNKFSKQLIHIFAPDKDPIIGLGSFMFLMLETKIITSWQRQNIIQKKDY